MSTIQRTRPFRSRGTAWHLNELDLNMIGAYVRRKPSNSSRLGRGAAGPRRQRRRDLRILGDGAEPGRPRMAAPRRRGECLVSGAAGQGLTVQGGIFTSLIGYDSLYAKDNFNYTRPWGADFTPYLMMGVNAVISIHRQADRHALRRQWLLAPGQCQPRSEQRRPNGVPGDTHTHAEGNGVCGDRISRTPRWNSGGSSRTRSSNVGPIGL